MDINILVDLIKNLSGNVPDCGAFFEKSPNRMARSLSYCQECSKLRSYGEKFVTNLLNQLFEIFESEKIFDWSDNKKYDFYLPIYNCIVEIHGKQHYSESDFSGLGGRTYIEEQFNDEYKKHLAIANGIKEYIVIKNIKSDMNDLKYNILHSDLPIILNFKSKDIDWDRCHEFCMTNKAMEICSFYKNESKDINIIADNFGCSVNTVKNRLKNGAKLGWCDYSSEKGKEYGKEKLKKIIIEEMSKPIIQFDLDGNFIKEFSGIQQAQRELGISHIWECLVCKRKTAGGFQWRYSDNCEDISAVIYKKSGKPYKEVNQYDKQMNLIKTWASIAEAAETLNINRSNIISVCKNKQKTSGGFIWKYKEGDDNDRKN